MTNIILELKEPAIQVYEMTPNQEFQRGDENLDTFLLNGQAIAKCALRQRMMLYIGALIAHSFLSLQPLSFKLATPIWKLIFNLGLDHYDLRSIDSSQAVHYEEMTEE